MSKLKGFTLVELLIALAILAILAVIAIPSYNTYVMKTRRGEGIGTLNSIQLAQEKYRTYNTTYGTLAQAYGGVSTTANGYYNLAITSPTSTGYTVTATAQGRQANDTQAGTACNVLTLVVNGLNATQTPTACWGQ